jgi:hypothetical protein
MTPNLSERFARDRGAPQDVGGVTVHNILRRRLNADPIIRVRRLHASANPVQGLRVKIDGGFLLINGQRLKDTVLWADSAPAEFEMRCSLRTSEAELKAWNCWRDPKGTMQAWIGDAGMIIEEIGHRTRLRCSDGSHPFSPTDLEVELDFRPELTPSKID